MLDNRVVGGQIGGVGWCEKARLEVPGFGEMQEARPDHLISRSQVACDNQPGALTLVLSPVKVCLLVDEGSGVKEDQALWRRMVQDPNPKFFVEGEGGPLLDCLTIRLQRGRLKSLASAESGSMALFRMNDTVQTLFPLNRGAHQCEIMSFAGQKRAKERKINREDSMSDWHLTFEKVIPYIARIETPSGFGSGFLFAYNQNKTLAAIATAAHVVEYSDTWNMPIKVIHQSSATEYFLDHEKRVVLMDKNRDSATILFSDTEDVFPDDVLPMMDYRKFRRVGCEIAWAGFPGNAYPNLCLFTGTVAGFLEFQDSYLVDGVAVNGVSGGPVFARIKEDEAELLGSVSSYMPNRQGDDTLPGLLRAQDVTAFQQVVRTLASLDEAAERKEEKEKKRRIGQESGENPPADPPVNIETD